VTGNLVCHGAETATARAAKHATAERRMNRPIVPTTTFRQGSLPLTGAAETINGTHNARPATLRPTGGAPAADKAGIWGVQEGARAAPLDMKLAGDDLIASTRVVRAGPAGGDA
jgi:hypothetical protein